MAPVPYKLSKIENLPILTLIVDSINARNAHWIKDEILNYIETEKPAGLLINLNNVIHIGHIGMGALIAINNQIRNLQPHAFVGLKSEVSEKIHASHLEKVFQLWSPAEACILCKQMNCVHHQGFVDKINEYPAIRFDESQIPHMGEKVVHQVRQPLDLDDAHPIKPYGGRLAGSIVTGAVVIAFLVCGTWLTVARFGENSNNNQALTQAELLDKFDINHDGKIDDADLDKLDPGEKLLLTFPPYCNRLGLQCSTGNGGK